MYENVFYGLLGFNPGLLFKHYLISKSLYDNILSEDLPV